MNRDTSNTNAMQTRRLEFPDGVLSITPLDDGRRRVEVQLADPQRFCSTPVCETRYSDELLAAVVQAKGLAWTGDEIMRDENPERVEKILRQALFRFLPEGVFNGKRILDFGSGSGASTMILARLFPEAEIVGVELDPALLALAEARQRFYRHPGVRFESASSSESLSPALGRFDGIILNAVYEHMRPRERRKLFPGFWKALNPGGVLLICETPYRWAAFEYHTTGLPLLNYLPDALCRAAARRYSIRIAGRESWPALLRMGIRGGSPREVLDLLRRAGAHPEVLAPDQPGGAGTTLDQWEPPESELFATWRGGPPGSRVRGVLNGLMRRIRRRWQLPMAAAMAMALRKPDA